jgi:hypothetical protein
MLSLMKVTLGGVENVIAINELFVSRQIQPVLTSICRALKLGLSFKDKTIG